MFNLRDTSMLISSSSVSAALLIEIFRRLVETVGPGLLHQQLPVDQPLQAPLARAALVSPFAAIRIAGQRRVQICRCDFFIVDDRDGLTLGLFLTRRSRRARSRSRNDDPLTH